jgi:hypothetical protein
MSQQADSADIILNTAVGIFFPKTEGTKTKAARVLIRWLPRKLESLKFLGLYNLLFSVYILLLYSVQSVRLLVVFSLPPPTPCLSKDTSAEILEQSMGARNRVGIIQTSGRDIAPSVSYCNRY